MDTGSLEECWPEREEYAQKLRRRLRGRQEGCSGVVSYIEGSYKPRRS